MNSKKNKSLVLGIIISLLFLSLFSSVNFGVVKADEITVTYSGITNPSSTHIAYELLTDNTTDWGGGGTEISSAEYCCTTTDNGVYFVGGGTQNKITFALFDFNISTIASDNGFDIGDISQIYIRWDGYGYAPMDGNFRYYEFLGIKNATTGVWITSNATGVTGTWSGSVNSATDESLILTIADANVSSFIDSLDYTLRFGIRTDDHGLNCVTKLYTDRVYITITTNDLTPPTLVSPTASATGVSVTPDFDWDASTGGTSPYTYEIMVADNLGFTSPDVNVTGISDTNYSYTTGLTPNTVYYWKVRTLDNASNYSDWTSTQSFTTAPFVAPTFTMPTSGMSITTTTPTFSWTASTGGDGNYTYELMVSLNSGFTTAVVNQTGIATTSYAMTSNLTPDVHYAKLRAKDSLGNYTDWTSTISFTAVAPSSGGASSTTTQDTIIVQTVQEPTVTDNDAVTTTSSSGSTNVFTKYVINPINVIFINPLRALWNYIVGLFRFSGQDGIIDIMKTPVGVDRYTLPLGAVLAGVLILILSFGDGIKMPKFKLGKRKRRKGKR